MKICILSLIISFFPFATPAQWYPLNTEQKDKRAPVVQILSDDATGMVVKVDVSGFELKEFFTGNKRYQAIDLLTEAVMSLPGSPDLPYIAKVLAIPDDVSVSVEVLETGEPQTISNIYLPPCRESWYEGQEETPYIEDANAYSNGDIYPNTSVTVGKPMVFRDFRIVRLAVYPIRYLASKKELLITSTITVKINYTKEPPVNPKMTKRTKISRSYDEIYRSFIFNYENALKNLNFDTIPVGDLMLCIMPDNYVADFQPFANWKRKSGIDVQITKFSDIGASSSTATLIRDYIADCYHNWEIPPSYVLLVGDYGIFPKKSVTYDYTFANENFFAEIDGDDYFPEVMVGRFPAQNTNELKVMVNKVVSYEGTPYMGNTDWYMKGTCCSNNAYPSQIETKHFSEHMMIEHGGFTQVDTLMSDANCTYDLNDVIASVNNGRSFLNYRGEGTHHGWDAVCYPFDYTNVSSINNGTKLTFVTSIGCGVARFDATDHNGFGEEWLKLGTPTNLRGAIAFIGGVSNTHTQYDNHIDDGIYISLFWDWMETPGQALLRGKLRVFHVFGEDPWVEYHFRVFCILGDPSVRIWKKIPKQVHVEHPSFVPFTFNEQLITVSYVSTGLPVDSARVTISGNSVFTTARTDSNGQAVLGFTPVPLDSLDITVLGDGIYPYQGKIKVASVSIPEMPTHTSGKGIESVYPNPFDESTAIYYTVPGQTDVCLKIFDINGRMIRILYAGDQAAGKYSVLWNGRDNVGKPVGPGMYVVQLSGSRFTSSGTFYKLIVRK